MSNLTLEDAKRALREANVGQRGDYYGRTPGKPSLPSSTEPADPPRVDQGKRRQTELAHPSYDVQNLPAPLVVCGCGDCPDRVDPLADEYTGFFDDILDRSDMAQEVCDNPRPMTLKRAPKAYLCYQKSLDNGHWKTSALERTQNKHGLLLGAERKLLDAYGDAMTTILLSLRLSPIQIINGQRHWVEPVKLDQWLHTSWSNVTDTMRYQLNGFEYEYVAITTTTTSAATPHTHALVYVYDPDDEVTIEMVRSMVQSHVNNAPKAYDSDHRVIDGEDDAGNLRHDPPTVDPDEDRDLKVIKARNGEGFTHTTSGINYLANQRPHWALKNVFEGSTDVHTDSVLVDGGAVAWACGHKWLKSSSGLDLHTGDVRFDPPEGGE